MGEEGMWPRAVRWACHAAKGKGGEEGSVRPSALMEEEHIATSRHDEGDRSRADGADDCEHDAEGSDGEGDPDSPRDEE